MEPVEEIERELYDAFLEETSDPKTPVMGRIIIGNASGKPLDELHVHEWKIVVLEVGLDYIKSEQADYEWYWEISIRDIQKTEIVINHHHTGYTASYVPGGRGCSGAPTGWDTYGDEVDQFIPSIMKDIRDNFPLK